MDFERVKDMTEDWRVLLPTAYINQMWLSSTLKLACRNESTCTLTCILCPKDGQPRRVCEWAVAVRLCIILVPRELSGLTEYSMHYWAWDYDFLASVIHKKTVMRISQEGAFETDL